MKMTVFIDGFEPKKVEAPDVDRGLSVVIQGLETEGADREGEMAVIVDENGGEHWKSFSRFWIPDIIINEEEPDRVTSFFKKRAVETLRREIKRAAEGD